MYVTVVENHQKSLIGVFTTNPHKIHFLWKYFNLQSCHMRLFG